MIMTVVPRVNWCISSESTSRSELVEVLRATARAWKIRVNCRLPRSGWNICRKACKRRNRRRVHHR